MTTPATGLYIPINEVQNGQLIGGAVMPRRKWNFSES